MSSELLTTRQVAKLSGLAESTLKRWRGKGLGPPWVKLAEPRGAVRYRRDVVDSYFKEGKVRDFAGKTG